MTCISNFTYPFIDNVSVNQKVLSQIMGLPDGLRKQIRLLAKQYCLLSIDNEPDITYESNSIERLIIRELPYIIEYKAWDDDQIFKWEIKSEELFN
jgi:hypothetical protein